MFKIAKIDEVYCRITGPVDLLEALNDSLSIPMHNYWFHPKYKMGIWDGKIRFFNRGKILRGLVPKVVQFFKANNFEYEIDSSILEKFQVTSKQFIRITKKCFKDEFIPNTHQMKGALLALRNMRGLLSHCTSAGKTFTSWAILNYLIHTGAIQNALIVVPRTSLVEQTVKEFMNHGVPLDQIGRFYGEVKEPDKAIVVSTWQSLQNKNKATKEILQSCEAFICDEVHHAKAVAIKSVLERCINARWRIGVTGTLPEHRADLYTIRGLTGNILDRVKSKELQKKGIISDLKLKILFLSHSEELKNSIVDFYHERTLLEENPKRNKMIAVLAKRYVQRGKNVLILYEHRDHGNLLMEATEGIGYSKRFRIDGRVRTSEREHAREHMNKNNGVLAVASYGVYSTGVNIKNLHVIIFASAGKAKIRLLQSVGRGLRKHPNKKHLLLFDIADSTKYAKKHLEKRLEYYTNEEYDLEMSEIEI